MADKYVDITYNTDENLIGTPGSLSAVVTGATAADPVVITAVAHGFANGETVLLESLGGMVEVNARSFTVASVAANTFELSGEDGSLHTAYTSGGTVTAKMSVTNSMRVIYDDAVQQNALRDTAQLFAEYIVSGKAT